MAPPPDDYEPTPHEQVVLDNFTIMPTRNPQGAGPGKGVKLTLRLTHYQADEKYQERIVLKDMQSDLSETYRGTAVEQGDLIKALAILVARLRQHVATGGGP